MSMKMIRTHVRFVLAGAIGLFAVVQALRSLPLLSGRAPLGAAALFALAALTVAGLVSLFRARLRAERELLAMAVRPSRGELVTARRTRLAEIAARGGSPDRESLAEAVASEERGRAYLGRYLVAVAVLIGLIGTFSGLASALKGLPAILSGAASDPTHLASLLEAPLGGLDVTFAAGIVGILATLALALAQGDLQLAEERMLARLEEETTHELIPTLWPRAHAPEERMLRELTALREENRKLLVEASAQIGAQVAEVTARSTGDVAMKLTAAVEASMKELTAGVQRGFRDALAAQESATTTLRDSGASMMASLEKRGGIMVELAAKGQKAQETLAETLRVSTAESTKAQVAAVEALAAKIGDGFERERTALVDQLTQTRVSLVEELTHTREALASELSAARIEVSGALTASADALRGEVSAARAALDVTAEHAVAAIEKASISMHATTTDATEALRGALDASTAALHATVSDATHLLGKRVEGAAATIAASAAAAQEGLHRTAESAQRMLVESMVDARASLTSGAELAQKTLSEGALQARLALTDGATEVQRSLSDSAQVLSTAATQELSAVRLALVEATQATKGELDSALGLALARLETVLTTSRTELGDTLGQSKDAIDRLVAGSIGSLAQSASILAESAHSLGKTNDQLGPQLEALAPELRALSHEVALLGTRAEESEEPLFADELVRLGEGMERLEALVRLAQGHGESAAS